MKKYFVLILLLNCFSSIGAFSIDFVGSFKEVETRALQCDNFTVIVDNQGAQIRLALPEIDETAALLATLEKTNDELVGFFHFVSMLSINAQDSQDRQTGRKKYFSTLHENSRRKCYQTIIQYSENGEVVFIPNIAEDFLWILGRAPAPEYVVPLNGNTAHYFENDDGYQFKWLTWEGKLEVCFVSSKRFQTTYIYTFYKRGNDAQVFGISKTLQGVRSFFYHGKEELFWCDLDGDGIFDVCGKLNFENKKLLLRKVDISKTLLFDVENGDDFIDGNL